MHWWPCCLGCPEYADNFNRADSTDLGSKWDEEVGDWSILSNELKEAGNSGSRVRFTTAMPNAWMRATIRIMDEQASDVYILYISWKDANDHLYAKFARDSGTNFTLSIHSVVGGVDTQLDSTTGVLFDPAPALGRSFQACITPQGFYAEIEDNPVCWAFDDAVQITDGVYAGVGHANGHASYFDDWELIQTWTGSKYCADCGECLCEDLPVKFQLTATYQGEGDCDTLDGITVTLNREKCGAPSNIPPGLATYTGTISGSCLDGLVLDLYCAGGSGVIPWLLVVNPGSLMQQACVSALFAAEQLSTDGSSTCDPFMLVFKFGPTCTPYEDQLCPDGCLPCGRQGPADPPPEYCTEYTITITE